MMRRLIEILAEIIFGFAQIGWSVISLTWKLPVTLVRDIFGGGQPSADVGRVAAQAQQMAEAQQERADRADDTRQVAFALRKLAADLARGREADSGLLERLPDAVAAYVTALSEDECRFLSTRPTAVLRRILNGDIPEGIRSPQQVAADRRRTAIRTAPRPEPEMVSTVAASTSDASANAARAARRDDIRAAIRASMRGEKPEVEPGPALFTP